MKNIKTHNQLFEARELTPDMDAAIKKACSELDKDIKLKPADFELVTKAQARVKIKWANMDCIVFVNKFTSGGSSGFKVQLSIPFKTVGPKWIELLSFQDK
jgi:hypothetical protein